MKLALGVVDIPYTDHKESVTTGDVAEWLEKKYHIKDTFADMQLQAIAHVLEEGLARQLENIMLGAPPAADPFIEACAEIDQMFRTFLDENQLAGVVAGVVAGVPTKAALNGVNHRFKGKQSGGRPSFIDTGQYQAASKSWMTDEAE